MWQCCIQVNPFKWFIINNSFTRNTIDWIELIELIELNWIELNRFRLAALHKNGDVEWRKRVSTNSEMKLTTSSCSTTASITSTTSTSESDNAAESGGIDERISIADRMKLLATAELGWKKRVNETDANRFTVAGNYINSSLIQSLINSTFILASFRPFSTGKMGKKLPEDSPALIGPLPKRKTPKPIPFPNRNEDGNELKTTSIKLY